MRVAATIQGIESQQPLGQMACFYLVADTHAAMELNAAMRNGTCRFADFQSCRGQQSIPPWPLVLDRDVSRQFGH